VKGIYALYADGGRAERAVNALRAAGVVDGEITIISAEPLEDCEFSAINRATWLWPIASGGGFVGLCAAAWLTRMTELAWPLETGNMPIVAWWPNLIIVFEMTMLGAILATVGTLVVAGGLVRRRPALYDPAVSDGQILVGVEHPSETMVPELERALRVDPDAQVKTV
jgi:hypothetical protein